MAFITAAYGVKGWIKLQPITAQPENLLEYPSWWIETGADWQKFEVENARVHGQAVAAKLAGCEDRETAAQFRGKQVAVSRGEFPAADENEFYWADLIGVTVVNVQGEELGVVRRVFETGANDVLVVQGDRERLIPFVEEVVREVDLAARVLRVDWGRDY